MSLYYSAIHSKRILVGITGGVAAYKGAELVRQLRRHGADVRVVMTKNACKFITPLSLQALSGHSVAVASLDYQTEHAMGHISLARWAELLLIAPASANCIARLSHGIADDLLSTVCLATRSPLYICPAMNSAMWENPATQENIARLKKRAIHILTPATGIQACGEEGIGRLQEPAEIIATINNAFCQRSLDGLNIMVTAGPTHEPIDPLRYISNRSSGRMGYTIAQAAWEMGATVSLISGPVDLSPPAAVDLVKIATAAEMFTQVMGQLADKHIFIATAAVADYCCTRIAAQKIKKAQPNMQLELERTTDILAAVAATQCPPFTVGFSAETERVTEYSRAKMRDKKVNMIAANQVGKNQGMGTTDNALTVFWNDGMQTIPKMPKDRLARELLQLVSKCYHQQDLK